MFNYLSAQEQIRKLRTENERLKAENEKLKSDVDYVAMMIDVELESEEKQEELLNE